MQLVIDGLNSMNQMLKEMARRGTDGQDDGPLAGDPLVRALQRQLRGYTTAALPGFRDTPVYLADFGVKTERDGTISLDTETFRKAFEANPDSFAAITNSRITTSSGQVSATTLGRQPAAGVYAFALANDGSATLEGDAMTRDADTFSISEGDAAGLRLSILNGGDSATIYVGTSLIEKIDDFATDILAMNSDLGQKIARYNQDLSTYEEELSDLDTRIESIRARYVMQFSAMESAVTSLKDTGKSLENMMDAWRASLQS
jgi:flagellar hook-associated protein 2